MTLRHAAPVEDLVLLPSGSMLATASANTITVWDLLSGGRVLQTLCAHSKTVTALCTDGSGEHLLSASLERQSLSALPARCLRSASSLGQSSTLLQVREAGVRQSLRCVGKRSLWPQQLRGPGLHVLASFSRRVTEDSQGPLGQSLTGWGDTPCHCQCLPVTHCSGEVLEVDF